MRHGFIRPPLHFTSISFAPYYSHLNVKARAWPQCVCAVCFIFRGRGACRIGENVNAEGRRKMREEKERERSVCMMQPLHLMQVPFAPYCLFHCWKKAGDLASPERQLIPFPSTQCFVCVFICDCLQCSLSFFALHPLRQACILLVFNDPLAGMKCESIFLENQHFNTLIFGCLFQLPHQ